MAMNKEICKFCNGAGGDCSKCGGNGYILTTDRTPYVMGKPDN